MTQLSTAVPNSSIRSAVGIQTNFKDYRSGVPVLPQRLDVLTMVSTGVTPSAFDDPIQYFNEVSVANDAGFGSPAHLMAIQIFSRFGDNVGGVPVYFHYVEAGGTDVAATGQIALTGTQTATKEYTITINDISATVTIESGDTAAAAATKIKNAIDAVLEMPITTVVSTSDVDLTAKWEGETGNDLTVAISGDVAGITFALTQFTGGTGNGDVTDALASVANDWVTMFVSMFDDSTNLDLIQAEGERKWGSLVKLPFINFIGSNETDPTTASTLSESRKDDRISSQISAPGAPALPFEIASRAVGLITSRANNQAARAYSGLKLLGLTAGATSYQWSFTEGDAAEKRGASTSVVKNSVIVLEDILTFYHPDGEVDPGYRYVVDIVKLQNIIFTIENKFDSDEWVGTTLLDDNDISTQSFVRKPKDAKAALFGLADNWGLLAYITDVDFTKENMQVQKASGVRNRIEAVVPVKLSDTLRQQAYDLNYGFDIRS